MDLLTAAKDLKEFIDTQPPGSLICPALKKDVRDTEVYKTASLAVENSETVDISVSFLKEVNLSLISLKQYIDQSYPKPLLWIGDQKTPVSQLFDYSHAEKNIKRIADILSSNVKASLR